MANAAPVVTTSIHRATDTGGRSLIKRHFNMTIIYRNASAFV